MAEHSLQSAPVITTATPAAEAPTLNDKEINDSELLLGMLPILHPFG